MKNWNTGTKMVTFMISILNLHVPLCKISYYNSKGKIKKIQFFQQFTTLCKLFFPIFCSEIMEPSLNMTMENETDENSHQPPNATLYFSHSTAVLPFMSLLGINQDNFILAHNNYEQAQNRYLKNTVSII